MQDLDIAKNLLKKNNDTLVIIKGGKVLFETNSSGIRGLLTAIEKIGERMKGSAVADKLVGEAAAYLCAYSNALEVFAGTLSQCGKNVLEKYHIHFEYENLVPHILNLKKTDLCPFEKIVTGSRSPDEAFKRLKQSI
jgi:putative ribosome biogenesis GTPase RsgA